MKCDYKIAILIVLYKCDINNSKTIASLKKLDMSKSTKIVIWNNGPYSIDNSTQWDLIQTIENKSLSFVYNSFIDRYFAERYAIFDYDTDISDEYLDDLLTLNDDTVFLPKVFNNGNPVYPIYKRKWFEKSTVILESCILPNNKMVVSIASGLSFNQQIIQQLLKKYTHPFDEKFKIYGVDTSFFIRLSSIDCSFRVISLINHSLSRLENEDQKLQLFRKKERLIDAILIMRNYYSIYSVVRFLKFVIYNFTFTIRNLNCLFSCLLTGRHPDNK